jgi:hypothetical protein
MSQHVEFLLSDPDARTLALGGCGTALTDIGPNTWYNPASLAYVSHFAVAYNVGNCAYTESSPVDATYAALALRLKRGPVIGISYASIQDDIQLVDSTFLGPWNFDKSLTASAAWRFLPYLAAGASVKAMFCHEFYSDIKNPVFGGVAYSGAFDAGVQYQPRTWLGLGLSITNCGSVLREEVTWGSEVIPPVVRLGWMIKPPIRGPVEVSLVSDVFRDIVLEYDTHGYELPTGARPTLPWLWRTFRKRAGLEVRVARMVSLRLGYREEKEVAGLTDHGGFTWGAGIEYANVTADLGFDAKLYDDLHYSGFRFKLAYRL